MRYLFGFLCVCALMGTSPLSASAQAGEEGATPEPSLEEPASDPAPEEPPSAATPVLAPSVPGEVMVPGVGVMTTPQIEREIEQLEKQRDDIKLAGPRAGVGITAMLVPGGAMMIGAGAAFRSIETGFLCPPTDPSCGEPEAASKAMIAAGVAVFIGGVVGVILTSRKLKRSKEQRDRIDRKISRFQRSLPAPSD